MTMGIVTKGLNAVYNKQTLVLWTEVVTGLIILLGLFGWMDVLIIAKWLYPMNPYSMNTEMFTRINQAPSVITVMINNFLAGGNQEFIVGDPSTNVFFFKGQKQISEMLIVIVFICVPIMLCTKPCVMMWCKKPHEEGHGHAGEFQPLNNADEGGI